MPVWLYLDNENCTHTVLKSDGNTACTDNLVLQESTSLNEWYLQLIINGSVISTAAFLH